MVVNKIKSSTCALTVVMAAVALLFNIISISISFPRDGQNLSFDYMGIIVAILGIMITTLIGWQIFNVFKIEDLKMELEETNNKSVYILNTVIKKKEDISKRTKNLEDNQGEPITSEEIEIIFNDTFNDERI